MFDNKLSLKIINCDWREALESLQELFSEYNWYKMEQLHYFVCVWGGGGGVSVE